MSENDFWSLTLNQLEALTNQYISEQEMMDYRAALICTLIAEVNRDRKKRPKAYTPKDFMPKRREKPKKKLSGEEMLRRAKVITQTLGGEIR